MTTGASSSPWAWLSAGSRLTSACITSRVAGSVTEGADVGAALAGACPGGAAPGAVSPEGPESCRVKSRPTMTASRIAITTSAASNGARVERSVPEEAVLGEGDMGPVSQTVRGGPR